MQNFYELTAPPPQIQAAIVSLGQLDADFMRIECEAGPLTMLSLPPTFAALVRIIIGQQLSTRVARAIYLRLETACSPLRPDIFLATSEEALKQTGLSRAKLACCQSVASAILSGELNLQACQQENEISVFKMLTAIKGIGPWTAELFMMFALNRLDLFPVGDLAIRRAYIHLKKNQVADNPRDILRAVESLRPYRSVAAHLLWHYYRYINHLNK